MDSCPSCGCGSYNFKDYGATICYSGQFGRGRESEEAVDIEHSRPPPQFCKCDECGRRFTLRVVREAKDA